MAGNRDLDGPPLTQSDGKSKVKYGSVFLFKEDINCRDPFSIVPLNFFKDTDFPWSSIEGEMTSESRCSVRSFSNLPGKYRIFGKIERGNLKKVKILFLSFSYDLRFFNQEQLRLGKMRRCPV